MMGLRVDIYKNRGRDFSNGGLSSEVDELVLVNVDGSTELGNGDVAGLLLAGNLPGTAKVVLADEVEDGVFAQARRDGVGPMMGGCYVASSDSRFVEAVERITGSRFYGAVALHDRYETVEQYATFD